MQKLIALLSLLTLLLLNSGCSSKKIMVTEKDTFENIHVKFNAPLGEWEVFHRNIKEGGAGRHRIHFGKFDIPGVRYQATFELYSENYRFFKKIFTPCFDPKFGPDVILKNRREANSIRTDKEQGINYRHHDETYLNDVKCQRYVTAQRWGGYNSNRAMKNYYMTCAYYDTNGDKQALYINYMYQASISQNSPFKMAKDLNYKREYQPILEVEKDFKQRLKFMFESIEFKNIDIERMKREGLYYPNKRFECSPW